MEQTRFWGIGHDCSKSSKIWVKNWSPEIRPSMNMVSFLSLIAEKKQHGKWNAAHRRSIERKHKGIRNGSQRAKDRNERPADGD
jgi:hypothetical protein